jgi:hypothetical protein
MASKNTLTVKIISPTQTIFDGEAYSISSVNSLGKFDILPFHANFITLVQKTPIILRVRKKGTSDQNAAIGTEMFNELFGKNIEEVKYQFDLAIIYTKDNLVKIYTQIQPQF